MVDVNLVLRQMEGAGTKLNLVVLDACRNNPFGGRGLRAVDTGLAQMRAPEGTLISFATQPGAVAQDGTDGNSPYTKAFAQTIRTQGLGIFEAINRVGLEVKRNTGGSQQPWFSSSPIDGNFFFAAAPANAPVVPSAAAAVPAQPSADEITWNFLKDSSDVASLNRFQTQFPSSRFRGEAQTKIAALERAAPRPAPAPAPPPVAATQLPPPPAPAPLVLPKQQQAALAPTVRSDTNAPIDTRSIPQLKLRMTSSFPKSLEAGEDEFLKRARELSDGKIEIQGFAAGEIVPGLQAFDSVSKNVVEMAWSVGSYYIVKDPAFQLLTNIPLGFDAATHVAWRRQSDVANLVAGLLRSHNVVAIPCGVFGSAIDFFSRKEVLSLGDLKGMKIRAGGFSGQILAKLGVVPQQLAGGDIYPALERGTIDATTWSDPYRSEKLGFNRVASYFYYPGVIDNGTVIDLFIAQQAWDRLTPNGQQVIQRACADRVAAQNAFNVKANEQSHRNLVANGGRYRILPIDVRRAMLAAWEEIAREQMTKSPVFKALTDSAYQRMREMVAFALR